MRTTKRKASKKLNDRQQAFCYEYIIDWNAARAARAAGYQARSSTSKGCELLRRPEIQDFIEKVKHDIEKATGVSKARQVQEYMVLAYANIAEYYDDWVTLKDFQELVEKDPKIMLAIESIDTKTEQRAVPDLLGGSEPVDVKFVKIKMHSKLSALARIDKLMDYEGTKKVHVDVGTNQFLEMMKASALPEE